MFTVGEFSRIAQVSKRLLRFYDEINLLKPIHTDPFTGYRYYSAEQMPLLNRILALRDMGLTLEQIQQIVRDNVTTAEIHGMFLLKKAEIERRVQGELQRLRMIESRLQSIHNAEANGPINVVLKHIPPQPVVSARRTVESFAVGLVLFEQMMAALPEKGAYGFRFCICHDDSFVQRNMDLEMGRLLDAKPQRRASYHDLRFEFRELPAAETMATSVVKGALETIHAGYMEIGTWAEVHGYQLAGIPREITLQVPQAADGSDLITEIQFPVEPSRPARAASEISASR